MYSINQRPLIIRRNVHCAFFLIGILIVLISLYFTFAKYIEALSFNTTEVASEISVTTQFDSHNRKQYRVTYHYEIDDNEYTCAVDTFSYKRFDARKHHIYYDSQNPSRCMTEYEKNLNPNFLALIAVGAIIIVISLFNTLKVLGQLHVIKKLNQSGKLVKNLPCTMTAISAKAKHAKIRRPVVHYTLPSGTSITLNGSPRYDRQESDTEILIDLVIDEENPDHYFMDLEINRLAGNEPTDFYVEPQPQPLPETNPPESANEQPQEIEQQAQ